VISNEGKARARGTDRDLRDHGWFVFFAPRDNPEIAGVIFGEHNEHGFLGAPIAKHVIETYFAKKEGRPLPMLPEQTPPSSNDEDPDSPPALPPIIVADNQALPPAVVPAIAGQ
jgi:penicillin-binding protein 2